MDAYPRKCMHYWRIHARVTRRILTDLPERLRYEIANDSSHESESFKWFDKKVAEDTSRLFLDPTYYDNSQFTFQVSRVEHGS